MPYTVNQLAKLAGISVRTLHHYDHIGLLSPASIAKNGYRQYGEPELLALQQILFFRELELPLEEIKRILKSPNFNPRDALLQHRRLMELKRKRLTHLLKTIDQTLEKIEHKKSMEDKDLYDGFTQQEMDEFAEEAKQRWGHTDAYKQSMERTKHMTKEDFEKIKRDGDTWMKNFVTHIDEDPKSPAVQELIAQHYNSLRTFYEPNLELYRGLANMYVDDARFKKNYDKYHPNCATFMRDAMLYFVETQEQKK